MSSIDNTGENEFNDDESNNIIGKSEDNEDEEITDKIKDEIKEDVNITIKKENRYYDESQFCFEITQEELKEKLYKKSGEPIMIFDIGNKDMKKSTFQAQNLQYVTNKH